MVILGPVMQQLVFPTKYFGRRERGADDRAEWAVTSRSMGINPAVNNQTGASANRHSFSCGTISWRNFYACSVAGHGGDALSRRRSEHANCGW